MDPPDRGLEGLRRGGLIVITTDQASLPGVPAIRRRARRGPPGPREPPERPGQPGGGRVGLLLLSQDLKAPGSTVEEPTNHFDLLRSLEDGFRLTPLGYAARKEVTGLPLATVLDTGKQ